MHHLKVKQVIPLNENCFFKALSFQHYPRRSKNSTAVLTGNDDFNKGKTSSLLPSFSSLLDP